VRDYSNRKNKKQHGADCSPAQALHTKTDPRGVTTTYTVDGLDRVLKKDYSATSPPTPSARFCYDGNQYNVGTDSCVTTTRSDTPIVLPETFLDCSCQYHKQLGTNDYKSFTSRSTASANTSRSFSGV
jgi:hypothetical protein